MLTVLIIVVALVLFLSVIIIHEFGHFIFAKLFGVKVNEFAVGMGPKLFSKKKGETDYSVRLLPIGGFCAMEGEDEDSDDERAFGKKKVWQKMIIVVAGAVFNIILGFIFMLILQAQEPYYYSRTIAQFLPSLSSQEEYMEKKNDLDFFYTTDGENFLKITEKAETGENEIAFDDCDLEKGYIYREAISCKSGLKEGDVIYSVNGYRALCFFDAYFAMSVDDDGIMDFVVLRDGEKVELKNVEFARTQSTAMSQQMDVTVLDFQVYGVKRTFKTCLQSTWLQSEYSIRSVYKTLSLLVTGHMGFGALSGPVGIATMIGEVAEIGFAESFIAGINNILQVMALIAFNLGIVNLLPLPALDGGRLVFLVIEAIRRKPVNQKIEGIVHFVGLMLLFGLMIAITYQDIARLFTSCVSGG